MNLRPSLFPLGLTIFSFGCVVTVAGCSSDSDPMLPANVGVADVGNTGGVGGTSVSDTDVASVGNTGGVASENTGGMVSGGTGGLALGSSAGASNAGIATG